MNEQQEPERVTMPAYLRVIATRLEAMAQWFDLTMERKLPIHAAYIAELAEWVEEDSANLAKFMRGMVRAIEQPELPLEEGVHRGDE